MVKKVQFKLVDIYNTRYLYLPFNRDLVYLFDTFLKLQKDSSYVHNVGNAMLGEVYEAAKSGTPVEFDLADAKLTPDISSTINQFQLKGIDFIDSKNAYRNSILLENRKRRGIDLSEFVVLPEYDTSVNIKDYIASLDKNTKYKMPNNKPNVYIPLVIMIMISRPSITVAFDKHSSELFDFVGSNLSVSDIQRYDEFYLTTLEGTMVVKFENGYTYTEQLGRADFDTVLSTGSLVPTVFGKEKLLNDEAWRSLFSLCLKRLTHYRATRAKTLEEIL